MRTTSIRKTIALTVAGMLVAAATGMTGCSGEPAQEAASSVADGTNTVEVVNSGATVKLDASVGDDGLQLDVPTAHYAFTVYNPHEGYMAQNVGFDVVGVDETGSVVFSDGADAALVYPGITTVVTGSAVVESSEGVEAKVSELRIHPIMSNVEWTETSLTKDQLDGMFTIENENTNTDGDIFTLSATVTGDLADADKIPRIGSVENVLEGHCVALLYDEDGKILMGSEATSVLVDQDIVDRAAEKRQDEDANAPINATATINNPPSYKSYELFVMPGLT